MDVAQSVGVTDTSDGRAVALADLWNRGVLDVVVANQNGPLLLYKNTVTPENQWIEFELEGTASNRSAIGAQVTALSGTASSRCRRFPAAAASLRRTSAGCISALGKVPQIEKAMIRWPSGRMQTIDKPAVGQMLTDQGARMSRDPPLAPRPRPNAAGRDDVRASTTATSRRSFITCILLVGQYHVRHPGELPGRRCWRSRRPSSRRWSWAALLREVAASWPAPTSPASASASWSDRLRSGLTRCAALISITSKYVLRVKGRHIWNPSNFGISRAAVPGA